MKKNILFIFSILLLLSINFLITTKSDFPDDQIEFTTQNIAFADMNEPMDYFTCYSAMFWSKNARVLECRTPCCYRNNFKAASSPGPGHIGGLCSGKLNDC